MTKTCEHIQACLACKKEICNYCVEVCDGCPLEGCEECYDKHLVQCTECKQLLCPEMTIIKGDIKLCPACKMQSEANGS